MMSEMEQGAATGVHPDGGPADGGSPYRYGARLANEIEARWQERWLAEGGFDSPNPTGSLAEGFERMKGRRKAYVLDMFPYPSGAGLHVGHPLGYIGTDVYARYLRMTGHHVVHTLGYDAFGLPAEQYAIDTGRHPRETTENNIANMRRQLRRLGLAHDARREVATTDPSFYRWTQWIFLQIFNSWADERTGRARPIEELVEEYASGRRRPPGGRAWTELDAPARRAVIDGHRLAYVSEELVNWCPGLGTVLANEEVTADGRSDVGNYPVYRRPLRQWMLRITAFADRLVDDLDLVDWPDSIKQMQRNWIGASDGARVEFRSGDRPDPAIEVFTTRPDTLPGATYVVLAPEHPLVERLVADEWPEGTPEAWRHPEGRDGAASWTPRDAVASYRARAERLSDRQRTADSSGKTGVFTGAHVSNPATGEDVPVFVADYVLMGYGTGAIMAVPAHDQRDLDFARRFGLDVRAVLAPPPSWLAEHAVAADVPASAWPEAFTGDGAYLDLPGPPLAGLTVAQGVAAAIGWLETHGLGRGTRSYRLRDWLFSRQRYWGEPFPIVYDEDGLPHALPEEMLPVTLPEMADFKPSPQEDEGADPVPPLAKAPDWEYVSLDLGEGTRRYRRELNTMPQWAGSCWYFLRYLDPDNDQAFVDPEVERYWMVPPDAAREGEGGVDLYVGGVEHAVLHLLYARFWHKVLYDRGHVSTKEPFRRLYNQGYILADAFTDERGMYVPAAEVTEAADGTPTYRGRPVTRRAGKMGKSLKNGVTPDDIYERYGADTLRLYEMAMGPLDTDRPWRTNDIVGVHRFLQRLWRSIVDEETGESRVDESEPDTDTLRRLHQTIAVVRRHFGELRFNTAIARLMELTTHAARLASERGSLPRTLAEPLVLMVAPLAPHVAEELWRRLGHAESLLYAAFPEADPRYEADPAVTIPVQVNGRTRFTIDVPADAGREEIERILQGQPAHVRHTEGMEIQRLVIVPGKIVNIVAR
ncbi:leucine--tRNA ligase [Actinomadura logoneensis]|uniref:Leucine--tRNA ligase n=1 Tax=Actinomadura logoneensis TaxID=2293572 RepID=A0A372JMV0_9ACTN|nr:class I tRNA ligase family protein [Actinomadura logoneensis]RFU41353.1 leucine--tRNA ligase [Actinomadura logoneensis]